MTILCYRLYCEFNTMTILLGIMSKLERETWTPDMDNALVDAFLNQQNLGNKVGGSFTSKAYEAITKELQEKFERPFSKEKVKGRWKLIKRNFSKCYDLFKNGLSGFAWDPITKRWSAEPEVWQKLIEVCLFLEFIYFISILNNIFY